MGQKTLIRPVRSKGTSRSAAARHAGRPSSTAATGTASRGWSTRRAFSRCRRGSRSRMWTRWPLARLSSATTGTSAAAAGVVRYYSHYPPGATTVPAIPATTFGRARYRVWTAHRASKPTTKPSRSSPHLQLIMNRVRVPTLGSLLLLLTSLSSRRGERRFWRRSAPWRARCWG